MKFKSFLRYVNLNWVNDLMQGASRKYGRSRRTSKKASSRQCFLEVLEDRLVPSANMYKVTLSTDNGPTTGPGAFDGQRDTTDPTGLSGDLRYVIFEADQLTNANSTITFGVGGTIKLAEGELVISQNTTVTGPGVAA